MKAYLGFVNIFCILKNCVSVGYDKLMFHDRYFVPLM